MLIPAHVNWDKISKLIAPSGLHETFKGNPDCLLVFANLAIDAYLEENAIVPSSLKDELNKTISYASEKAHAYQSLINRIHILYENFSFNEFHWKNKPVRNYDDEKKEKLMIIKKAKSESFRFCRKELEKKFPFLLY